VFIRKLVHVILSEAKNLCGPVNYEILRRLAPQNDIQKKTDCGLRCQSSTVIRQLGMTTVALRMKTSKTVDMNSSQSYYLMDFVMPCLGEETTMEITP
jgi:hypothetical protein